ncbi:MAG: hypothetical protein ACI8ZM_000887 [Crocinitomix sp.]|jgi:hypothetical protein
MSENFNLEEQLRQHLLDGTEPTPPDLFAKIEAQIEGKERRKKRLFIWFWFGAGLAIIGLGILLSAFGGNKLANDTIAINEISNDSIDLILVKPASKNTTDTELALAETEINAAETDSLNPNAPAQFLQVPQNSNSDNKVSHQTGGSDLENNEIDNASNLIASVDNHTDDKLGIDLTDKTNSKVDSIVDPIIKNNGNDVQNNEAINTKTQDKIANNLNDNDTTDYMVNHMSNPNITKDLTDEIDSTETANLILNDVEVQNTAVTNSVIQDDTDTNDAVVNEASDSNKTNSEAEIDSTIVESTLSNDLMDTIVIAKQNRIDSTSNPAVDLVINKDSIRSIDSTKAPTVDTNNTFGLLAYGGYMAFDQAVFKPYFTSGVLSQVSFPSVGSEFGLGAYYRFNNRFEFSLIGSYAQQQTSFNYDLMISESDFFNLYENDVEIPLENLDDPTSCNCFLAQDASLDYSIQTLAISLNASYDLIKKPRYSFGPLVGFGTVANTKFTNNSSTIIGFSPELKERFTSSILRMGLNFHYQITPKMQVGLAPSFNLQFAKKSSIYAKNSQLFLVPIQLKWAF